MDSGLRIARIFGIPVFLHPTWFVVFALLAFGMHGQLAQEFPDVGALQRLAAALFMPLLLFGSVLMHELGHSIVALRHRVAVRSITLFIFGGVAWMEREPDDPSAELKIALAGPATSAGVSLAFGGVAGFLPEGGMGQTLFVWLAALNAVVAIFNLLPGFPLDGGRVLRAILWRRGGDPVRATRTAARAGQGIAYGLVALGAFMALAGDIGGGIWLAFIGWFVLMASGSTQRRASVELSLSGLVARDVMTPKVDTIDAETSVARFTQDFVMHGARWALVLRNGEPIGLVTLTDARELAPDRWESTPVHAIATPMDRVRVAEPATPVGQVLQVLSEVGSNQIPIVDGAIIVGAVTRRNLLQAIEIRGAR